jgi:hypothetical protein
MKFQKFTLLLILVLSYFYVAPQDDDFFPPNSMRGSEFVPPNDKAQLESLGVRDRYQYYEGYLPLKLSDWERLKRLGQEGELDSVDIYGFQKIAEGKKVDANIQTQPMLRQFKAGISENYVMRLGESDIGRGGGGWGGGTYLGILKFNFKHGEAIIIGVGHTSFFLDVWYGSNRQSFFSRPLAEALNRWLISQGIELPKNDYDNLSGLSRMVLPKEFESEQTP